MSHKHVSVFYKLLATYNVKLNARSRHVLQREPPLPVYIGLNVHQMTRSKKLINQFYKMGFSISYDRVIELEEWITASVCEWFEEDGVLVPAGLRKGLFTVGALDSIDHNPSCTSAGGGFHGCGISLFQFLTKANAGGTRNPIIISLKTKQHCLQEGYAVVPAVVLAPATICVPKNQNSACSLRSCLSEEHSNE